MDDQEKRCKKMVRSPGRFSLYVHQCRRAAVKDGYCKQHHPVAVAARRQAQIDAWTAAQERSPVTQLHTALEKQKRLADLLKRTIPLVERQADRHGKSFERLLIDINRELEGLL